MLMPLMIQYDLILKNQNKTTSHIHAIEDSFKEILNPAISNETLQEAKAKADANSIRFCY
jgi:uncharacterized protein